MEARPSIVKEEALGIVWNCEQGEGVARLQKRSMEQANKRHENLVTHERFKL